MNTVREYHQRAMEFADQAFVAKQAGQYEQANHLFFQAYDMERHAAEMVAPNIEAEPTRSVLHRSAATLAMDCGCLRDAERLVCIGLAGEPPEEIAEELQELLEAVWRVKPRVTA